MIARVWYSRERVPSTMLTLVMSLLRLLADACGRRARKLLCQHGVWEMSAKKEGDEGLLNMGSG